MHKSSPIYLRTYAKLIDIVYCHRKFRPLSKSRLWYTHNLIERSLRWRNENEETSPPSLKRQLFLRHSAVKVPKRKCVADTTSVKISSQSGSSSLLNTPRLSLNQGIRSQRMLRNALPTLSSSLDSWPWHLTFKKSLDVVELTPPEKRDLWNFKDKPSLNFAKFRSK